MKWDDWQIRFFNTKGDKILYCGRQVGKSRVCAKDCGDWAANNPNTTTLMIAPTERQSKGLFRKALEYVTANYPKMILRTAKDKPTSQRFALTNGAEVWCLPTGLTGDGIRFLTVHRLYCEEMARIPRIVFDAVNPMLLTTGGDTIGLTTPAGTDTDASDIWNNKDEAFDTYTRFSVSSEDIAENRPICATWTIKQKTDMQNKLRREKARMSELRYAQEYLGKEIDSLLRLFPKELLDKCMTIPEGYDNGVPGVNYLGVDVAGMGGHENVLACMKLNNDQSFDMVDLEIFKKVYTTTTSDRIIEKISKWNYRKIYVDDGGVGFGVFCELMKNRLTRSVTIPINNSSRPLNKDETNSKKILKDELYINLKSLMEQGRVRLYKNVEVYQSLASVYCEDKGGKEKIYGEYTHIAEALIRAVWGIMEQKSKIRIDFM